MLDIQLGVGVGAIILTGTTELWQMQIVSRRQKQFVSLPAAIYMYTVDGQNNSSGKFVNCSVVLMI